MKFTIFLPPVIALAIAGIWLGSQRGSVASLEEGSLALRKQIALARAQVVDGGVSVGRPDGPGKTPKEKEKIDWKNVAAQLAQGRNNDDVGAMRAGLRLQQRLHAMSAAEILAALDDIQKMDLPVGSIDDLERMLIGPLAEKDTEAALSRFINRVDERGSLSWGLSKAMENWLKKDPASATAWFDREVAAGNFDSRSLDRKNRRRSEFEAKILSGLLSSDPAAAGPRLQAIPEEQRADAINQLASGVFGNSGQIAFAEMVRQNLPTGEQADTLGRSASRLVHEGGLAKASDYLDRIKATPSERAAAVGYAAETRINGIARDKVVSREDVNEIRSWTQSQAPEKTGEVTGKALSTALNGQQNTRLSFSDAAALVEEYYKDDGDDVMITTFLNSGSASANKERSLQLAGMISDEKSREEFVNLFK